MSNRTNVEIAPINFIVVEEEPLMKYPQALTIVTLASLILVSGILIHIRIYTILSRRTIYAAIDKLILSNTILSLICHPLVLIYYISSNLLFPMSDYIGTAGCLISVHFMDVFVRFYNFCFPASIAMLRYLFIVQHSWVKSNGVKPIVNAVIACTMLIPLVMSISVQFPISDSLHAPYSRCTGRFETYFNPTHPDPISPGINLDESVLTILCLKFGFVIFGERDMAK